MNSHTTMSNRTSMMVAIVAALGLVSLCPLLAADPPAAAAGAAKPDWQEPLAADGWLDLKALLVPSSGSRSLGDTTKAFNDARDRGSKIVFFDPEKGDNEKADVYWWDGKQLVDSAGKAANPVNGKAYGADPLAPDEDAIRPFRQAVAGKSGDPRLRTNASGRGDAVAGGYPDWFLFRRGRTHDTFDGSIVGGRSRQEPTVIAAYGPPRDGRAIVAPTTGGNPAGCSAGRDNPAWLHMVLSGLDIKAGGFGGYGSQIADSRAGGPVTAYAEDCRWAAGKDRLCYLPKKTTIRRSVVAFNFNASAHNQGYYTSGFDASTTFDEVIFYRNGYKSDPRTEADPGRDIFSRNIYQGGGAQMGHQYLGIISADGASGGPQMRLGGRIEDSLIVEGYWYSGTESNSPENPWLVSGGQSGQSAVVRNNVQLVFAYPTPNDPDTAVKRKSATAAQPGWGYAIRGASFGSLVEGNIVSQAMLIDELGVPEGTGSHGISIVATPVEYEDEKIYTQRNNTIRGNIVYRTGSGLDLRGDWIDIKGIVVENNVFVGKTAVAGEPLNIAWSEALSVRKNRFYSDGKPLPIEAPVATDNTVAAFASAAKTEGWPDPNRTVKRYVTEVLKLTILDWADDPTLDPAQRDERAKAGEAYDPTGLKTFMAVATNMRRGSANPVPASGKPSWTGDYAWDERLTGPSVVNWIRAGFGLPSTGRGVDAAKAAPAASPAKAAPKPGK